MDSYTTQISTRYGTMTVLDRDLAVGAWLKQYGEWAQGEIDLMCSLLRPGSAVVDIGAFIGTHTLPLARCVGDKGSVLSGEPRPEHFAVLKHNVEQNHLSNVHLLNAAFSDKVGEIQFPPIDTSKDFNFGGQGLASPIELKGITTSVPVTTVDRLELDRCDLIKVDVEGMEGNVLRGAKDTIARLRPIVYAECLTMHAAWEIIGLMRPANYDSFIHLTPLYSPTNFRQRPVDISQGGQQTMVLSLPGEKTADMTAKLTGQQLVPIVTIDDMVMAFLKCPMYWDPFLAATQGARMLGLETHANFSQRVAEKSSAPATNTDGPTAAQYELKAIRASWSWRLTAPLRAAGRLIKR